MLMRSHSKLSNTYLDLDLSYPYWEMYFRNIVPTHRALETLITSSIESALQIRIDWRQPAKFSCIDEFVGV